ncbi:MAG: hypothetical protein PHO93_00390 [Candidatus Saccharimonadaceae bacterium]|nr:hypothetical protein [Candidatus Saccharimonadaceae bacterium]
MDRILKICVLMLLGLVLFDVWEYVVAKQNYEEEVQRQAAILQKQERFVELHNQEKNYLFSEGSDGRLELIEQEISFILDYYKSCPIGPEDAEARQQFDVESTKLANLYVQAIFEHIYVNSADPSVYYDSNIVVKYYEAGDLGREFKVGDSVEGEQIVFSNGCVYQGGVQIDNSPLSGFVTDLSFGLGEFTQINLDVDSLDFPDGYYNCKTRLIYHPKINLEEMPVQVPNPPSAIRGIFFYKELY